MTFCIFVHNLSLNLLYKIVGWSKRISYWRRDNCKVYIETIICIHLLYNISQKIYVYSSNKSLMSSELLLNNEWKRQFIVVIRVTLNDNIFLIIISCVDHLVFAHYTIGHLYNFVDKPWVRLLKNTHFRNLTNITKFDYYQHKWWMKMCD